MMIKFFLLIFMSIFISSESWSQSKGSFVGIEKDSQAVIGWTCDTGINMEAYFKNRLTKKEFKAEKLKKVEINKECLKAMRSLRENYNFDEKDIDELEEEVVFEKTQQKEEAEVFISKEDLERQYTAAL